MTGLTCEADGWHARARVDLAGQSRAGPGCRDEAWLAGLAARATARGGRLVAAARFFSFHPVLAGGPSLDRLTLRAAASDRHATEGTTLVCLDGHWRVLASDGRDGPRETGQRYPVLDLELRETGSLDAPCPSNIPWPTLVRDHDGGCW